MHASPMKGLAFLLLACIAMPSSVTAQDPSTRGGGSAMRAGDRIVLAVVDEPTLSDTFTVSAGPSITLPLVGLVPLAGVSRDGLQSHLAGVLARVIRDPVVTVQTLVRLAVLGEVARPGFFAVPADALLSDAITLAGGPTGNAEMRKLTLSRQGNMLQRDEQLRQSIAQGRTIDDLGITAGDELMVPRRYDSERTVRILGLIVGIPLAVFVMTRF